MTMRGEASALAVALHCQFGDGGHGIPEGVCMAARPAGVMLPEPLPDRTGPFRGRSPREPIPTASPSASTASMRLASRLQGAMMDSAVVQLALFGRAVSHGVNQGQGGLACLASTDTSSSFRKGRAPMARDANDRSSMFRDCPSCDCPGSLHCLVVGAHRR